MKFSLVILSLLGSLALCHADAVRLQINGPDGQPVAGAQVRVLESKGPWYARTSALARDLVSDGNGVVALESQSPLATDGLDATKAFLQARVLAPGLAMGTLSLKAGDNPLALKPGKTLEGVALGNDEKPIAGAHLFGRLIAIRSRENRYPSKACGNIEIARWVGT